MQYLVDDIFSRHRPEGLANQLDLMRKAVSKPMLDEADIGSNLAGDHTAGKVKWQPEAVGRE
jgi:hypothetical protein